MFRIYDYNNNVNIMSLHLLLLGSGHFICLCWEDEYTCNVLLLETIKQRDFSHKN